MNDINTQPKVGQVVRLKTLQERFPHFAVEAGATGVISAVSDTSIWIKMDDVIEGCEEWDNDLSFTDDDLDEFWDMVELVRTGADERIVPQHLIETRYKWIQWFKSYGIGQFFDAFTSSTQGAKSECVHCGSSIYVDIIEGGGVPDWKTDDGDYGCHLSPDTCEDGTGGHEPLKLPMPERMQK